MNTPKVNTEVNLPPATHTAESYGHNTFTNTSLLGPPNVLGGVSQFPPPPEEKIGSPHQGTAMQSPLVEKLSEALAKAQGMMKAAAYNRMNPHFKSRYADLASVWDAIREPLAKNGLAVTQTIHPQNEALYLYTHLRHASGQWVSSRYPLPIGAKAQEFGSALTYARRYSLASIAGIASDEDDDAEVANKIEDKPVTPEQIEHLLILINGDQAILDRLLAYVSKLTKQKIEKLEDIPQSQFPTAFAALSKKVKATAP